MKRARSAARKGTDTLNPARGRILARVLAEDLREVRGEDDSLITSRATRTDPPPGYDLTFVGSDNIL